MLSSLLELYYANIGGNWNEMSNLSEYRDNVRHADKALERLRLELTENQAQILDAFIQSKKNICGYDCAQAYLNGFRAAARIFIASLIDIDV